MPLHIHDFILFGYLLTALYWDVRYTRLPNWLTAGGMAVGLLYHIVTNGLQGLMFSAGGLLVAGGIFLLLYIFKALGAGDVKLFAAIGSLVGIELVLYFMMYSVIFAGIIGIVILLFTRTFLSKMTAAFFAFLGSVLSKDLSQLEQFKATKSTKFPFMYAVIPAVVTSYYYVLTV
ncbi:prepilin peptidase CpaA [Evansella caseinilytica]|uniref:Prepilin peptidase CpaA n=1 Tax=Evansella caseinilytica TaxID=1503961 RepID=A0A1H3QXH1_9BACI|nr:prepilin peptidase [Evansella caseinilytica]SDZ18020.1 prepilin peptidase CpaA [Evansella caseinilytica]